MTMRWATSARGMTVAISQATTRPKSEAPRQLLIQRHHDDADRQATGSD